MLCLIKTLPFLTQAICLLCIKQDLRTGQPKHRFTRGDQPRTRSPFLWQGSGCLWHRNSAGNSSRRSRQKQTETVADVQPFSRAASSGNQRISSKSPAHCPSVLWHDGQERYVPC